MLSQKTQKNKIMELNNNDRKRIRLELKISTIIPIILFVIIVIILAIGSEITGVFVTIKSGVLNRSLTILLFLFVPFLYFIWLSLLKYIDLKRNNKIRIQIDDYEIKKVKNNVFVVSEKNNFRIKIFEDLTPLIDINYPLSIEFTKLSKVLLFVSNNNQNLLDRIEKI